jgi:methylthioribose-1-phosphate isomerase
MLFFSCIREDVQMDFEPVAWRDGQLIIIDQTLLPNAYVHKMLATVFDVWEAIKALRVRGAPAIGVCAAFGVLVGLREKKPVDVEGALAAAVESADYLATSRPTAVNLFNALDRMKRVAGENANSADLDGFRKRLEAEAIAIFEEDQALCHAIGNHGAALVRDGDGVLTHCNAGGLATSGYGTALAVLFRAHELGRRFHVFADETRPLLQGARLTAWELMQAGIDVTLICDNMAAQVMREGRIQFVIVGADRIAANGDTANKIGTYSVAVNARAHNVPFYVAAPSTTFDLTLKDGRGIPIEQRSADEITNGFGQPTAPLDVNVYNPAFDVTPAALIAGIITESGILRPPYESSIADCT